MNATRKGRTGSLALALVMQSGCDGDAGDSVGGQDSTEETASAETMGVAETDDSTGAGGGDEHSSTTSAIDPSADDDGSTSSAGDGPASTDDDASSSSGAADLPCIDPHFVVFLATDGVSYVDVPAGIEVKRTFTDGSQQAPECHLAAHGECLLACVDSDVEVALLALTWPCAGGAVVAIHSEMTPPFMMEVDVAATEAAAGCG